jgi:phospholipase/carboxylesterase
MMLQSSPHQNARVFESGLPLSEGRFAIILLHGRGGSAQEVLHLGQALKLEDVTFLAPEAAGHSWYPNSFMAPVASNEPWLSSALALIDSLVVRCQQAGIGTAKLAILGFSQGACLATEYVARYPRHYGALIALTGGLIGPLEAELHHDGSLAGTTALLSSGDPDPHVPWSRVEASAKELIAMGASVHLQRHPGRPHTILGEEINDARKLMEVAWSPS